MKNAYLVNGLIILISFIIISGCVDPYPINPPPGTNPTNPANPTSVATSPPTSSNPPIPSKLLSSPTWTWNNRIRIKYVDITDDGRYVGGVSTQKVVVKTPDKTLMTNLVWSNARLISIADSGNYFAVADRYYVNLYDKEGGQLYTFNTGGQVNEISVLDNGILLQGSDMSPHMSELDTKGNQLWIWKPVVSTEKALAFGHDKAGERIAVGTQDNKIYLIDNGGHKIWTKSIVGNPLDIKMTDNGDRIFVLTDQNRLSSFDRDGNKRWDRDIGVDTIEIDISRYGDYVLTKPYNKDNVNYYKYKVSLYDNDGYVKWTKQFSGEGVYTISEDARHVLLSDGRDLMMYDLNGNEEARYTLDGKYGSFFTSIAVTPDASKVAAGTTNHLLVFG